MSETATAIAAAHRAEEITPAQTVARTYQRIRTHDDPAIFISLRSEEEAIAEATALSARDARKLPLENASVTRILSNLPFGKQLGSHRENIDLYNQLSQEFARVLDPKGLMVTLTSEDRLWDEMLSKYGWKIIKKQVLVVLGQPASIFVTERAET